jgi:hypothetical protein
MAHPDALKTLDEILDDWEASPERKAEIKRLNDEYESPAAVEQRRLRREYEDRHTIREAAGLEDEDAEEDPDYDTDDDELDAGYDR